MTHTTDNSSTEMNKCIHGFKLEKVYFRSSQMKIVLTILGYEGHCNTETCNTQQLIIIFIRVGLYTIYVSTNMQDLMMADLWPKHVVIEKYT
jgi:hypothetical protein